MMFRKILIVFTHLPTSDPTMELTNACIHTQKCVVLLYNALYLFESQTKDLYNLPKGSFSRPKLALWASRLFAFLTVGLPCDLNGGCDL